MNIKFLIILLLLSFSACVSNPVNKNSSENAGSGARTPSSWGLVSNSNPPKVLYHYGSKEYLLEDDRAGNIPQKVWDEKIMSKGGHYRLPDFRKGFYGSESAARAEFFGGKNLRDEPWIMKITLKDKCVSGPLVETNLEYGPDLSTWLATNPKSIEKSAECLYTKSDGKLSVDYRKVNAVPQAGDDGSELGCEPVLEQYLQANGKKVVHDGIWPNSWYIRDRECIEKVEASPKVVLETLANMAWHMNERDFETPDAGYGAPIYAVLFSALADLSNADPVTLALIKTRAKTSDIQLAKSDRYWEHVLYDAKWSNQELNMDGASNRWLSDNVPILLDAYSRCQKIGKPEIFREQAAQFSTKLGSISLHPDKVLATVWQSRVQLVNLCRVGSKD